MITFACPTCSKSYSVPPENAHKKTKCTACRTPLVVPGRPEDDWEPMPDDLLAVPPGAGSSPTVTPHPDRPDDPEPECYRAAERCATALAVVNRVAGVIALLLVIGASSTAFGPKHGEAAIVTALAGAVAIGVSLVATELARYLVLVFVDLARNSRAVRLNQDRGR